MKRPSLVAALAAVMVALALGCGAISLPPMEKPTEGAPTPAGTWDRSAAEIHGLPIRGENIGVEVGTHVPPFALELADGSILTSADLLDASQPTFLFFWATT